MNGIQSLRDLFLNRGREFLDLLLKSKRVTVYEKMDGLNFSCTIENGKIDFYKKNRNSRLGDIERTLTKMYEPAIDHLQKSPLLNDSTYEGYTFSFIFFPEVQPNFITYDRMPLNHLILNYVEDFAGNKILNKELLDYYAEILEVGKCPILYDDELTPEQTEKIFAFLEKPKKEFSKMNFAAEFLSILMEKPSVTLNNQAASAIEGLIFRFEDKDGNYTVTKLEDPYFEELQSLNKNKEYLDHTYYLVLSDIVDFILTLDLKKISMSEETWEKRYIELICEIFNRFIENSKGDYDKLLINLPKHLLKEYNDLNYDNIKNETTLEYILVNSTYKEILKIFIASFRKKRTRENYIFTKALNKIFNNIVNQIQDCLLIEFSEEDFLSITESSKDSEEVEFIDFEKFYNIEILGKDPKEILGIDMDLDTYIRKQPDYIKSFIETNFDPSIFLKSTVVEVEKLFDRREKRNKLNLIIDSFDPMTNVHLDFINHEFDKNGIPFTLIAVFPRKEIYSNDILEKGFAALMSEYPSIESFLIIDRPNIKKIAMHYERGYKINKIYANKVFSKMVELQIVSNYRDNNYLGLPEKPEDSFDYFQTDLAMITKSELALKDGKFTEYKKYVPDAFAKMFNEITRNVLAY